MKPDEICIGDKLQIKREFFTKGLGPLDVVITDKIKGNADGGYIFLTDPSVGSGYGISAEWLERRTDK